MKSMKPLAFLVTGAFAANLSLWAGLTPEQLAKLPPAAQETVNFSRDIKPIFEASCVKCHGRGKDKGGFRLDNREALLKGGDSGPVAIAGQSAQSHLIELVSGLDPENVMPVKGSRLTPMQVGLLRAWIDQGMPWDAGVSFGKEPPVNFHPRSVSAPPVQAGLKNGIDRWLAPYFKEHKVKPGRPVDDRVFARRAYLDIIGLLPPPEELEAFVNDSRKDKRERLVDRLLARNRAYAEHWLTFWNDLLRNDYRGTGYIDGGRKQISSWLFSALANNMPYDQFVAALVNPTTENEGFVKGILWRGVVNASQTPEMQAAQNVSQVFMGVNLKCASCHDSFINDWTLADAYGLASVYATNAPLEMFQCDKPTGRKSGLKFIYPELGAISADASNAERKRRLAEIITSRENGRLNRTIVNRLWQKFMGRGLVEPVDDMEQPAWNRDLLDWLAEDLVAHRYDLKRTIRLILTSRAYQLPAVNMDEQKHADYVFTGPAARRMSAEQFRDALGSLAGVWFSEPAAQFDFTAGSSDPKMGGDLIPKDPKWIWTEANTVRAKPELVYFWKSFELERVPEEAFVVAACDNSYTLYVNGHSAVSGKEWSQPNFKSVRSRLKPGRNVIAVEAANHTPDNKLPAADKTPSDAEGNPAGFIFYARLRDGGRVLDFTTDASWVWSKEKKEGWEKPEFKLDDAKPAAEVGPASIEPWKLEKKLAGAMSMATVHGDVRTALVSSDPLTVALGRPPREQVNTTRPSGATTLQALELTNGETLNKLLKSGAEKVLAQKPASSRELVTRLYARGLGRKPTENELKLAEGLLGKTSGQEQVEDLLWALAMLPEFQLIY
jgi:mono/diheme cytochrome c family protein